MSTFRKTNKQTDTEHGEVNLQIKRACPHLPRSGLKLTEEICCGQKKVCSKKKQFTLK